ncbi:MAG: response regulator [Candidatus Scalinduaceae bacterium]
MSELGRILIADDEETFLHSTADLLRREGYACDCVPDAGVAIEKLRENSYDVLIADIHMPGNPELELVRELPKVAEGMPVILVTGQPSLNTATQSIQLPVAAYMIKPIEFHELLAQVRASIEGYRAYRAVSNTRQRLREWSQDLNNVERLVSNVSGNPSAVPINTFFVLTLKNIVDALMDLKHLTEELTRNNDEQYVCNLLACPRLTEMKNSLVESVKVLEKTRSSFKSKDLGELRKKLDMLTKRVAK